MENLTAFNLAEWPFENNALHELQRLVQKSTHYKNYSFEHYTLEQVDAISNQLYNDYCFLVPDNSEKELIVLYTCQYIGAIRAQMNELFTYWKQTKKHFFVHGIWLEQVQDKLLLLINRIEYRWAINFGHLPAPEFETYRYIQSTRRVWKDVHSSLLNSLNDTDLRLVALNVVRSCRVAMNVIVSRNRLRYNEQLLLSLLSHLATDDFNEHYDNRFINLLIKENFYEEFFVTYFIDTITDLLSTGGSIASQRKKLAPWYDRLANAPAPCIDFTFNFHTPEEVGLPPFRQLMKEILDKYNDLVGSM